MSDLGARIKKRRLQLDLTLFQIAEYVGVKEATAQRYESGEIKNIKHETIVQLADILKCSPQYLMGWDDNLFPAEETGTLSSGDSRMLEKYRSLDEMGKHTVTTVLNMEYERCTKPHLEVMAAHADDYSENQIKLMEEDLDEL